MNSGQGIEKISRQLARSHVLLSIMDLACDRAAGRGSRYVSSTDVFAVIASHKCDVHDILVSLGVTIEDIQDGIEKYESGTINVDIDVPPEVNDQAPPSDLPEWAFVSLLGHRQLAGSLSFIDMCGAKMIRIATPQPDGKDPSIEIVGPLAVYQIKPASADEVYHHLGLSSVNPEPPPGAVLTLTYLNV